MGGNQENSLRSKKFLLTLTSSVSWQATTFYAIAYEAADQVTLSLIGVNFIFLVCYVLGQTYLDSILKTAVQVVHGPNEGPPQQPAAAPTGAPEAA